MKKIFILFAVVFIAATAKAYDFSAVAPSGQTLYYKILNSGNVKVTHPASNGWGNYSTPAGDLVIPGTVVHNGVNYTVSQIDSSAF